MKTPEEIIKKNIPNGIVNIHAIGKGNGKPQHQAETDIIKKCIEEYADQSLEDFTIWAWNQPGDYYSSPEMLVKKYKESKLNSQRSGK